MKTTQQKIAAALPERTYLTYVDYRDNLDGHDEVVLACINENSTLPLENAAFDWYEEAREHAVVEYLEAVEGLTGDDPDLISYAEDLIRDRDASDPAGQLIKNTPARFFVYNLGADIAPASDPLRVRIRAIKKALKDTGITLTDKDAEELTENAYYGGELCILWSGSVGDLIGTPDGHDAITITGAPSVAIIDYGNGSGHDVPVPAGQVPTLRLDRARIGIDRFYSEKVCGLHAPAYAATVRTKKTRGRKSAAAPARKPEQIRLGNVYADTYAAACVRAWNDPGEGLPGPAREPGHLFKFDTDHWKAPARLLEALKPAGGYILRLYSPNPGTRYAIATAAYSKAGGLLAYSCELAWSEYASDILHHVNE